MAAHPKPLASFAEKPRTRKTLDAANRKPASRRAVRQPVAAAKAKAHFLQLLDEVQRDRKPITITKRGRVVAQIVPAAEPVIGSALEEMFGRTAGMLTIRGDIVSPNWDGWGPEWR